MSNVRRRKMTTRIVKHAETEDVADELDHPIPALNVIDVTGVKRGGGADLCIIIARPIQDDLNSQSRLLTKIEGYLAFIRSPEFLAKAGLPNPGNTHVQVHIHPQSSPSIFELLERCKPWVLQN